MNAIGNAADLVNKEREELKSRLQRLDIASIALGKIDSRSQNGKRVISAAGRRRISMAQKARWAKVRKANHR